MGSDDMLSIIKDQKRRRKVRYVPLPAAYGMTDPQTGEVRIDYLLKEFPDLERFVVRHELAHRNEDKNVWDCIKREIKDYPKLMLYKDRKAYEKRREEVYGGLGRMSVALLQSLTYRIIMGLIFPFIQIYALGARFGRWTSSKFFN